MAIRKLTTIEALWSLWNLLRENIPIVFTSYAACVGLVGMMWSKIQFEAAVNGSLVYFLVFAIFFFAGLGLILLILILRGDIGFRRVLIAQIHTMEQNEFIELREFYLKLVSDITTFIGHQKELEPVTVPWDSGTSESSSHEEWTKKVKLSMSYRNRQEGLFWEKFGPRLVDLGNRLKKAGADPFLVRWPLWAILASPQNYLADVGAEIEKLRSVYITEY